MSNIKKNEIKLIKKASFVIVSLMITAIFINIPINVRAQQRSMTIYADYTLTGDIVFDPGHGFIIGANGITLDGNGYNISGYGGSGVLCSGHSDVKIKNLTIQGFHEGISIHVGQNNNITGNYISDNGIGIVLSSTLNNITNNIIARNEWWGIIANGSQNSIYRNLLINNEYQILDSGWNYWYDPWTLLGNFWSNYFGLDDGSGAGKHAIAGDYIGDTEIPHESVDYYPLLDPSIPEAYGPLPYADWWMWGRGGSSVDVSLIAPNGDEVSEFTNTIGPNAYWAPNPSWNSGEAHALVMVSLNPYDPIPEYEGDWTLQLTAVGGTYYTAYLAVSREGILDLFSEFSGELEDLDNLGGQAVFNWASPGEPADVEKGDIFIEQFGAPTIHVSQPVASQHIYNDNVDVEGTVTDYVGEVTVKVNDVSVTLIDNTFSTSVGDLIWGENKIKIEATAGENSVTVWRTIYRVSPPVITSIDGPLDPVAMGTDFEISGSFIDESEGDTHTATWDWGDGEPLTEGTVTDGVVTGSYNYDEPGVYSITLTVEDSTGESDTFTWSQYMVIYDPSYDPSDSFVTGGGWIESPFDAYPADPYLIGKAPFGFVAKCKKGSSIPTGNTEFQFRLADLNFHSETYDWLVITGSKAMFKGTGTINGEGSYKFILTAIDGEITGDGVDKFRIKIWEEVNGAEIIFYDNKQDTAIGSGSITIHKKGK